MARLTRAGIVAEAGRTPEEVDEAVRQLTGTSVGASARRRKQVTQLTLGYVTRARLEAIAARWSTTLTGAVERLVLEAEMPRGKR